MSKHEDVLDAPRHGESSVSEKVQVSKGARGKRAVPRVDPPSWRGILNPSKGD